MPRLLSPRVLVLLIAVVGCGTAGAEIRRCVAGDGSTIYTDRRCQDLGAVERLPQISRIGSGHAYRYRCPATLQDLAYQLSDAIGNGDVNQVASVYYWTGQSTRSGYALMGRLEAIARRPLVDIVPVYPAARDADVEAIDEDTSAQSDSGYGGDFVYPQQAARRRPIGLRLEQTLVNGSTPSRTVLGLRRAHGCWWITL